MAKGSEFERSICKDLSLWWSNGSTDDLFWRTAGSGGRATVRGKKGKTTKHSAGDICATDPVGQPFIDFFALELKRGYNKETPYQMVDAPENAKPSAWETWIEQAEASRRAMGSKHWMIIHKRDRRQAICAMPAHVAGDLGLIVVHVIEGVALVRLEDFLATVKPERIIKGLNK